MNITINITKEQYYDKETAEAKTYSIWYNKELLLIWERYHEKGPIKMSIIYCFECGSQLIFQNSELLDIHTLKPHNPLHLRHHFKNNFDKIKTAQVTEFDNALDLLHKQDQMIIDVYEELDAKDKGVL